MRKSCKIEGCDTHVKGHGWCDKHYQRWKKYGDPLKLTRRRKRCRIEGCGRLHNARELCLKHYTRWLKFGDPYYVTPHDVAVRNRAEAQRKPVPDRFWAKVDKDGPVPACAPHLGPCWCWTGAVGRNGYGRFGLDGRRTSPKTALPHRVAYELLVGPIPDGLVLDHLCRNPLCVNPTHLEAVTHAENLARSERGFGGAAKVNAEKTHCVRGHLLAGDNLKVLPDGKRQCLPCRRIRDRKRRAKARDVAGAAATLAKMGAV